MDNNTSEKTNTSETKNSTGKKTKNSANLVVSNYTLENQILRFKIILLGDASVGKTCILQRFIHNKFRSEYNATIGVDYWVKSLDIDNDTTVDMQIWDTCGQERFKTITRQYYRDSNGKNYKITIGCILVFDLTKKETFKNIEVWLEDTKNFGNQEMVMIIVGNKSDLKEKIEVNKEEIENFKNKYNYNYYEVSALTGDNVKVCFENIGKLMVAETENVQNNSNKKFKVDKSHISMKKSVELLNNKNRARKNKCC